MPSPVTNNPDLEFLVGPLKAMMKVIESERNNLTDSTLNNIKDTIVTTVNAINIVASAEASSEYSPPILHNTDKTILEILNKLNALVKALENLQTTTSYLSKSCILLDAQKRMSNIGSLFLQIKTDQVTPATTLFASLLSNCIEIFDIPETINFYITKITLLDENLIQHLNLLKKISPTIISPQPELEEITTTTDNDDEYFSCEDESEYYSCNENEYDSETEEDDTQYTFTTCSSSSTIEKAQKNKSLLTQLYHLLC